MKIPKILFQISDLRPPKYLREQIKETCHDWVYVHFIEREIISYINRNPIPELENSLEKFKSGNAMYKESFFKYYFLYINGGVYLNPYCMIEQNLSSTLESCSFFAVQSCVNPTITFSGFIGSEPKNQIIYEALKEMYDLKDKDNQNKINFDLSIQSLVKIVEKQNLIEKEELEPREKGETFIFTEKIQRNISKIKNDKNELILSHYFKNDCIPSKSILEKNQKLIQDTKIGITLVFPDKLEDLFINEISQKILYFTELLLNIGYDCYFICDDKLITNDELVNDVLYDERFKIAKHSEILFFDFDIIFIFGYELQVNICKMLNYLKTKLIKYMCGNSFFIDSENILYNQHKNVKTFNYINKNDKYHYDQIWCMPQIANTNQYYWKSLYRCKCKEVPFIWSNKAILLSLKFNDSEKEEKDLMYKKKYINKRLTIFEPNISIMKWCLPALLVCENAYRLDEEQIISKVYLCNILDKKKNSKINEFNLDSLNQMIKSFDLFDDKKIIMEGLDNTLQFMSKYADITVSHQMENPLNYLYFELAWMGWPIIHNAHLCKDIGYYYEGFNYEMGGKVLMDVVLNHDSKANDYLEKNRKVIDRYLPTNTDLQAKYRDLIEELYE